MDLLLILDTETTALTPTEGACIEVASVLYSLENRAVIKTYSTLLSGTTENAAEPINHIPARALGLGVPPASAWKTLDGWASVCDAVLAHNADFDRQWVPAEAGRMLAKPWIDTCHGVTWPKETKPGNNLIALALEHGLGVVDPHRALSDCLLLARLLTRCAELGQDVVAILARGLRPMAMFQALVSFEEKDLAKDAGFTWEAPTKRWLRKMAIEDASALGFPTKQVAA